MRQYGSDIVSISLDEIAADSPSQFRLFLLLAKNQRLVPLVNQGDTLGRERLLRLTSYHYRELWRLRGAQAVESAVGSSAGDLALDKLVRSPAKLVEHVRETLRSGDATPGQTKEALKAVSQGVLKLLGSVQEAEGPVAESVAATCRNVVDEVLRIASEESDIYTQILALRQANSDMEHSTAVGTMAVMFALSVGLTEPSLLNDLATAALFHDIGLSNIRADLAAKKREAMTPEEKEEYYRHVQKSVSSLKDADLPLRKRVYDLIASHHLSYDGRGFPAEARSGDELTQILALADRYDELCDKGAMSAAEAFDHIHAEASRRGGEVVVNPELLDRIFQFMKQEQAAAAELRERAGRESARVRDNL